VLTHVKGFFFYDLTHLALVPSRLALARRCVSSFFLQKRLVRKCCATFLCNDKIRRGGSLGVNWGYLQLVRVFADVVEKFTPVIVFVCPFSNVVMWFLLLKSL
jgi:hypothetical protein